MRRVKCLLPHIMFLTFPYLAAWCSSVLCRPPSTPTPTPLEPDFAVDPDRASLRQEAFLTSHCTQSE